MGKLMDKEQWNVLVVWHIKDNGKMGKRMGK